MSVGVVSADEPFRLLNATELEQFLKDTAENMEISWSIDKVFLQNLLNYSIKDKKFIK